VAYFKESKKGVICCRLQEVNICGVPEATPKTLLQVTRPSFCKGALLLVKPGIKSSIFNSLSLMGSIWSSIRTDSIQCKQFHKLPSSSLWSDNHCMRRFGYIVPGPSTCTSQSINSTCNHIASTDITISYYLITGVTNVYFTWRTVISQVYIFMLSLNPCVIVPLG
jgi:hypothetical protein